MKAISTGAAKLQRHCKCTRVSEAADQAWRGPTVALCVLPRPSHGNDSLELQARPVNGEAVLLCPVPTVRLAYPPGIHLHLRVLGKSLIKMVLNPKKSTLVAAESEEAL